MFSRGLPAARKGDSMTSGRTSLYFDLLDGFKKPGCSICRYALRAVERFFDSLTYENTNDPGIRNGVRAARGFCNRHSEQYLSFGDELGTAIIYRDLLHTLIPAIEAAMPDGIAGVAGAFTDPTGDRRADSAIKALAPTDVCLACRRVQESEDHYLSTLIQHLSNREFAVAFAKSEALCTVHFDLALNQTRDGARRDLLKSTQRRRLDTLLGQLEGSRFDDAILPQALSAGVGGKGLRP